MSFSLFQRPSTIAFLDDDPDYLEMLAVVLPRHWHVKLFIRPSDCVSYLQQEPPFWEADAWNQQQMIDQWRDGKPLIAQILAYWSRYTERFSLTGVCVVDYSMPGTDGLQALADLADWPGSRVLLTGQADEQVAVRAFNRGLIDQFIAKQTPDISRRLVAAVEQLLMTPNPRYAQLWRATLTPEQSSLMRVPAIQRSLSELAASRWAEHVVIGDPFGVLGMAATGEVSWLQLETPAGLKALAELAELEDVDAAGIQDIRDGKRLVDLELRQALGLIGPPCSLRPAFPVGDQGQLIGALFDVTGPQTPNAASSYSQWLARQEPRAVKD